MSGSFTTDSQSGTHASLICTAFRAPRHTFPPKVASLGCWNAGTQHLDTCHSCHESLTQNEQALPVVCRTGLPLRFIPQISPLIHGPLPAAHILILRTLDGHPQRASASTRTTNNGPWTTRGRHDLLHVPFFPFPAHPTGPAGSSASGHQYPRPHHARHELPPDGLVPMNEAHAHAAALTELQRCDTGITSTCRVSYPALSFSRCSAVGPSTRAATTAEKAYA